MEVLNQLRSSFGRNNAAASATSASGSSSSLNSTDTNNNSDAAKKRGRQACDLCGKRLLKLAGWRNYFTLPCRCRHMFCKQCITGRLQCRQKVLRSASFNLMWTFPCPGSNQCHQQLTVDFARGSSYSRNLVARDIHGDDDDSSCWEHSYDDPVHDGADDADASQEMDNDEDGSDNVLQDESDVSMCDAGQNASCLREIG